MHKRFTFDAPPGCLHTTFGRWKVVENCRHSGPVLLNTPSIDQRPNFNSDSWWSSFSCFGDSLFQVDNEVEDSLQLVELLEELLRLLTGTVIDS